MAAYTNQQPKNKVKDEDRQLSRIHPVSEIFKWSDNNYPTDWGLRSIL